MKCLICNSYSKFYKLCYDCYEEKEAAKIFWKKLLLTDIENLKEYFIYTNQLPEENNTHFYFDIFPSMIALSEILLEKFNDEYLKNRVDNDIAKLKNQITEYENTHKQTEPKSFINKNGYKMIYMPNSPNAKYYGYVYEHREVAMKKLGRNFHEDEVVHHIDGNRLNNHPDNLAVMTRKQHFKLHVIDDN